MLAPVTRIYIYISTVYCVSWFVNHDAGNVPTLVAHSDNGTVTSVTLHSTVDRPRAGWEGAGGKGLSLGALREEEKKRKSINKEETNLHVHVYTCTHMIYMYTCMYTHFVHTISIVTQIESSSQQKRE